MSIRTVGSIEALVRSRLAINRVDALREAVSRMNRSGFARLLVADTRGMPLGVRIARDARRLLWAEVACEDSLLRD